jgi:L-ribulose-5-phosphate 4-epimerase
MNRLEAKNLVLKAGIELVNSGLIVRTWGNVSCRIDDNTFAITPSGKEYLKLTPKDIVEINIDDLSYKGTIKPSSENRMHRSIYELFPDINFIIHTHQENASAISATGLDFINLPATYPGIGDQIRCAEYALPGTKALSNQALKAFKSSKGNAIILKHHGTLCIGKNYDETFKAAHELEKACKDYIRTLGQELSPQKNAVYSNNGTQFLSPCPENGVFLLNNDPEVVHFTQLGIDLKPFLDDFAQIVGTKVKKVNNDPKEIAKALKKSSAVLIKDIGALCWGKNKNDATAVSIIMKKNCKAYFTASLFGKPKPIKRLECLWMRRMYVTKYSKLAE